MCGHRKTDYSKEHRLAYVNETTRTILLHIRKSKLGIWLLVFKITLQNFMAAVNYYILFRISMSYTA